LVVN
jgi:hypothetical protein